MASQGKLIKDLALFTAQAFLHPVNGRNSTLQEEIQVAGAAGLTAGMRYVLERGTDAIAAHEQKLLAELVERLAELDGVELFAGAPGTQTGVLSFRLMDLDCEEAAQRLAEHGVCLRSGLHCAPCAHRSAGTLETGTLRASFSAFSEARETEAFCTILKEIMRG